MWYFHYFFLSLLNVILFRMRKYTYWLTSYWNSKQTRLKQAQVIWWNGAFILKYIPRSFLNLPYDLSHRWAKASPSCFHLFLFSTSSGHILEKASSSSTSGVFLNEDGKILIKYYFKILCYPLHCCRKIPNTTQCTTSWLRPTFQTNSMWATISNNDWMPATLLTKEVINLDHHYVPGDIGLF